jgi:hypothetical protein
VLEAHEGNPATTDDQLTGVGAAHTYHEVDVRWTVDLEQILRLRDRVLYNPLNVGGLEELVEIGAIGVKGVRDYRLGLGAIEVKNKIMPVR